MSGVTKLMTAGGGGVALTPASSIASDVTVNVPSVSTTLVGTDTTQTLTNKTIQGGTVISGTAVASTFGTSIDFTDIPSWVKRITVMFADVSTSGSSLPQIKIGAGSFISSGYLGTAAILNAGPAVSLSTTGFGISPTGNWASTVVVHGSFTICLQTGNTWVCAGSVARSDAAGIYITSGSLALGGTLDRVRITTVNGTDTFDAGSINILYE